MEFHQWPSEKEFHQTWRLREILDFLRQTPGVFLTNNERDVSQSDFKCRIMPQTTLKVAPYRDETGYFGFEVFGGATVHIDLMKKQINPFEKLRLVRKAMPNTLIQGLCRGRYLFGYRPYPDNVIEMTVRLFSKYVDIWRIYDFMNYIPNLVVAAEAVKKAGKAPDALYLLQHRGWAYRRFLRREGRRGAVSSWRRYHSLHQEPFRPGLARPDSTGSCAPSEKGFPTCLSPTTATIPTATNSPASWPPYRKE